MRLRQPQGHAEGRPQPSQEQDLRLHQHRSGPGRVSSRRFVPPTTHPYKYRLIDLGLVVSTVTCRAR